MGLHPRLPGPISEREPGDAAAATAVADEPRGPSRRGFLARIAAGGAALTVGSQLLPVGNLVGLSGAQEAEGPELTAEEEILRFLASVGFAGAAAYQAAIQLDSVSLTEPVVEILRVFGSHHSQQATALASLLPAPFDVPNATLVDQQTEILGAAADEAAVLTALVDLEEAVTATHLAALAELETQFDAQLVASALPVCAQHAVVLGTLAGVPLAERVPETQTADGALSEDELPVEGDAPATPDDTVTPEGSQGGDGATANTTEPAGEDVSGEG